MGESPKSKKKGKKGKKAADDEEEEEEEGQDKKGKKGKDKKGKKGKKGDDEGEGDDDGGTKRRRKRRRKASEVECLVRTVASAACVGRLHAVHSCGHHMETSALEERLAFLQICTGTLRTRCGVPSIKCDML